MSAMQRRKGKVGELELCQALAVLGHDAYRTAPMQAGGVGWGDIAVPSMPSLHFEVKRQERLMIPQWVRQAEADASMGRIPVVAFRQSREPWRVVLRLDHFVELVA